MTFFDVKKLTDENTIEWVKEESAKFEEVKNYPKTIFAQYNWWIDFISRIIWSIQIKHKEEMEDLK